MTVAIPHCIEMALARFAELFINNTKVDEQANGCGQRKPAETHSLRAVNTYTPRAIFIFS